MKVYDNVKQLDLDIERLNLAVENYNYSITAYIDLNKGSQFTFSIINEYVATRRLARELKKVNCKEAVKNENLSMVEKAEKTIEYLTNYRGFFLSTNIVLTSKGVQFEADVIRKRDDKQK